MKRAQASSPDVNVPKSKKAKLDPSVPVEGDGEWTKVEKKKSKDTKRTGFVKQGRDAATEQEGTSTADGEWTRVEKRKGKKANKAEAKLESTPPRFMYSNADIIRQKHAVGIDDIRDLILHVVADAPSPGWLRVENPRSIQKVVTLLIPGLTPELLSLPPLPTSATSNPNLPLSVPLPSADADKGTPGDPEMTDAQAGAHIPFIAQTFSHACPTRAPGDTTRMHSVLNTFFQGLVSGAEKNKRMVSRIAGERALSKDPASYLLSLPLMVENDYPVPSYLADVFDKGVGWVQTPEPHQDSLIREEESLITDPKAQYGPKQTVYALDCEMCLTEDGKELTRICVIDYHTGLVVYDTLVKPKKPILDYLTRWSGITEAALEGVTTSLEEVQTHVLKLVSPPKGAEKIFMTPILIGHSLESDLKALKLCHPLCIDTALIFHHPRGRPLKPGLAWLTKKWCGREIQVRGEGGHDPEEDARACIDLLQRKIINGPGYGEFKTDFESIFERMTRSVGRGGSGTVRSAVVDHGNPAVMHGSKATTAVACKSDDDVLAGILSAVPAHQFVFGRFMALADCMGWTTPKAAADAPPVPTTAPADILPSTLAPYLDGLNAHLAALHASLPSRTALLIFTGHSDPRRMSGLNARKNAFETALRNREYAEKARVEAAKKAGNKAAAVQENGESAAEAISRDIWWTGEDARELEQQVELAKRGLLFLAITK